MPLRLGQNLAMPRYYFDTHDAEWQHRDEEGLELPGLDAVQAEVMRALPEMARSVIRGDGNRREISADVRDEAGRLVYTARLSLDGRRVG